jgi:hypothetical protein
MRKVTQKKTPDWAGGPHCLAVNPPQSFVGSLPPFTVAEKRAARQRATDMLLPIKKSYELLATCGCFAREICDECGIVLGAVRFTRHGESEVYCARECRGDAQRSATSHLQVYPWPSWRSSFLSDPGTKFLNFCGKLGIGTKKEEQRERSAGERCGQQSVGSFTTANSLLQLPRTRFWPVRATFPSTPLKSGKGLLQRKLREINGFQATFRSIPASDCLRVLVGPIV